MHYLKIAFVNVAVVAGCAIILELIFGGWFNPDGIEPLSRLNVPRDAHLVLKVETPYESWGGIYTRDSFGLRGNYDSPAAIDVLTIGGSTTDQRYLSDEDTWQEVIARKFAQDGRKISVVNAGVDGHSTVAHLSAFEYWFPRIPDLHPRFILVYAGLNEHNRLAPDIWVNDPVGLRDRPWYRRVLEERSALWRLYRTARGMIRANALHANHDIGYRRKPYTVMTYAPEKPSADEQRGLDEFAARLKAIAEQVVQMGARPIFVTQPHGQYSRLAGDGLRMMDGASFPFYRVLRLLNQTTMMTCQDLGAVCIDLEGDLIFDESDFYDWIHNSPSGARKIGEYLYSRLKDVL